MTTKDFIDKANIIHNSKYDYSKVEYINNYTKVLIICPIHGEFWQRPSNHLNNHGCPICKAENNKGNVFGKGFNDTHGSSNKKPHQLWISMMSRCYSDSYRKNFKSYIGCEVSECWHLFSNFKEWFEKNYVEGWQLDKDILVKGNKIYSPDTCCFVPNEINLMLTNGKRARGKYPIGVSKHYNKFTSYCRVGDVRKCLGQFDTPSEAFFAYKKAKETHIRQIADKWKNQLEPKVYEALYNYQVEITD